MQISPIEHFKKETERLTKKYRSLPEDLATLSASILENPMQGKALGKNCYKIRLKISSKKTGKDGGGRVVTCVKIVDDTVHLLTIYDKSEKSDLEHGELDALLAQI